MRYKAPKGTEVSSCNAKGETVTASFKAGTYATDDSDEISMLDACAEDPANPIGFDPKES